MLDQPLRLSVRSHKAGSGKGCAMNVISWENRDEKITDFPLCTDYFLAKVMQRINDTICSHRGESDLLCPECSIKMLELAHRTTGTSLIKTHTDKQRAEIYAKIARTEVFYTGYPVTSPTADDEFSAAIYSVAHYAVNAANTVDATNAAVNAANAINATNATVNIITQGHRIIDHFEAFSSIKATPVGASTQIKALQDMLSVK